MTITPPAYFEPIRQAAERRWQQLEADPELAGPWHQLFKQVQSPRHVLSELLQNADDAGASEASASIRDGVFEFNHNGEDFQPDHFASLCRFGYSNKRSLHTIGFRGIGFKSTFSLGPVVGVRTPSLSIFFEKERFTLPCWYDDQHDQAQGTRILVQIQDDLREAELRKNLNEWRHSPVSLLFFRNIRKLTVNEHQLFWQEEEAGPVPNSHWYSLNESPSDRHLLVHSEPEHFPTECIEEIKQERIVGTETDFTLPPSRVELVLGASPCLYVVLPTAVRPQLPFACNGPFMQDPARVKIKDPETSPTNRWLLSRVGKLAAACIHSWLNNHNLSIAKRAAAYRLLPAGGGSGQQGIDGNCAQEVERHVFTELQHFPFVLSQAGTVEPRGKCISLDKDARHIWPEEIFSEEIDPNHRRLACEYIQQEAIDTLYRMGEIDKISRTQLCSFLRGSSPPHPGHDKLLALWVYLSGEFAHIRPTTNLDEIAIVPISGRHTLCSPRASIRLSSSKAALSEEDNSLISSHILILDKNWIDFLDSEEDDHELVKGRFSSISAKDIARALFQKMGLAEGADTTKLIEKVISSLSQKSLLSDEVIVRIAHICARLDCRAPKNMVYLTLSGEHRPASKGACIDKSGQAKNLFPRIVYEDYFISDLYGQANDSCSAEEWQSWIASTKPGLKLLPHLERRETQFRHSKDLVRHISMHYSTSFDLALFPFRWERLYPAQRYTLVDHAFPDSVLEHWTDQAGSDTALASLARIILEASIDDWCAESLIQVYQTNTNGLKETLVEGHSIKASWLHHFQSSRCIPDTRGDLCRPGELLRRSEQTEPLIGIERFIDKRLDIPQNNQILDVLGVSAALPGPHLLLSLLRTLSALETPHLSEAVRLYEQLDKIYQLSAESDKNLIIKDFNEHKLILTEQGTWSLPGNIFISGDGLEVAGISTVIASTSSLSLWRQLGIKERPNAEAAIEYVESLEIGAELDSDTQRLVCILFRRFAGPLISGPAVWLNLEGKLTPTKNLTYGCSSSLFDISCLFDSTLAVTADFRFLDSLEIASAMDLCGLRSLERFTRFELESHGRLLSSDIREPSWLSAFALCLKLIERDGHADSFKSLTGREIAYPTRICFREDLRLIPTIDRKPIGRAIAKEGAVVDETVFVRRLPSSRLANLIPSIIGEYLDSPDLQAAASYCYERPRELVIDYFRANFGLAESCLAEQSDRDSTIELGHHPQGSMIPSLSGTLATSCNSNPQQHGEYPEQALDGVDQDSRVGASNLWGGDNQDQGIVNKIAQPAGYSDLNKETSSLSELDTTNNDQSGSSEPGAPGSVFEDRDDSSPLSQYSVIQRFAMSMGMSEVQDGIFVDAQNRRLVRQRAELFPWVLLASDGEEIKRILVKTSPLSVSPLEIDTVAFGMLEKFPAIYSILGVDTSGDAKETTGQELQAMINSGALKVCPATYRLTMAA